jgi:tetratricopeptide (TPR) repeat protein
MINRKNLCVTFVAALASALLCVPAHSKSKTPTFFGRARCPEYISCIADSPPMSIIVAGGPKMSLVSPADIFTISACTSEFDSRQITVTIKICEGYLNQGTGPARDRATAMYFLGHAYSRSRLAFANSGKVTETKAFKLWSKAVELDPSYIEPLLSIGNMCGWSGEDDQAQAAFDRAEKIDPKDWRVYTGRANAYFNSHTITTHTLALAAAEKAAAIEPDEPFVRMVYGRMLQINERYEDAAKQYEGAVGGYDPLKDTSLELMREPNPLQSLAYVYSKMGKPALAAETLTKYIDGVPAAHRYFALYQERAGYYELAGSYAKAAADFKDAAIRAPAEYAEDLKAKQAMLLVKAGAKSEAGEELLSLLARGNLKPTLKIQVFLRNQGYEEVTINGKYDAATKHALDACLLDKTCAPIIGQAI